MRKKKSFEDAKQGSKNLRVLMLTQYLDPTRGGAESVFYQTAKELSKRGHKIFIIKHKVIGETLDNGDIKIFNISPYIEHKGRLSASFIQHFLYFLNCVRVGLKLAKSKKVDLIHANNYTPILSGWIISKITKRPLIVTIHDVASLHGIKFWQKWMGHFGGISYLKSIFSYIAELITIKLPKNMYTVSEASKTDILMVDPDKRKENVCVIPNGIDLQYYYTPRRNEIKYDNEIAFIGRLVFYKRLDTVIRALSLISRDIKVKLTVLGNGPMRTEWEELASKYNISKMVNFYGYVPHLKKLEVLSRISALVLPSVFEGFGIVVLEAWAFKKPIIVANVRPLNEIVDDGLDGFIANPDNPIEWAGYIKKLLEDKPLARRMGENGYRKLVNYYTIEKCVDELEQFYFSVLKKGNHKREKSNLDILDEKPRNGF